MTLPGKTIFRAYWTTAVEQPSYRRLLAAKRWVIGPMLAIFLVSFLLIMVLAGYARPLLSEQVSGSFNLGFLMIVGLYCLCWVVAVRYVAIANSSFDAKAAEVASDLAKRGAAH